MDFFNAGEEEAMRLHSFMHVHKAKVKQVCKKRESRKKRNARKKRERPKCGCDFIVSVAVCRMFWSLPFRANVKSLSRKKAQQRLHKKRHICSEVN